MAGKARPEEAAMVPRPQRDGCRHPKL